MPKCNCLQKDQLITVNHFKQCNIYIYHLVKICKFHKHTFIEKHSAESEVCASIQNDQNILAWSKWYFHLKTVVQNEGHENFLVPYKNVKQI